MTKQDVLKEFCKELSSALDELPEDFKERYANATPAERMKIGLEINDMILDRILSGKRREENE